MGDMSMQYPNGVEVIFEADGVTISKSELNQLCDKCEQLQPTKGGYTTTDHTGQAILWFCFKCRLMQYQK